MADVEQPSEVPLPHKIVLQLRFCGHFLHYRMGDKAGRKRILAALLRHQELLQRELQDILAIQSGSLSEMIIKMETDGLIEKGKSAKDGRHIVLRLTPEGLAQAKRSKEEYDRQVKKMMSCFSEEQLETLYSLLSRMTAHWEELEEGLDFSPARVDKKFPEEPCGRNNE